MRNVPGELTNAIRDGRCIAFVGAGFTADSMPPWRDLLKRLASPTERATVDELTRGTSWDLEAAAQIIRDHSAPADLAERLQATLAGPLAEKTEKRRQLLLGTPFRAILTTNFDTVLGGVQAGTDVYREVLRDHGRWQPLLDECGPPIIKLHGDIGDIDSIVLSARDYRVRLHTDPRYVTFLRAIMSTYTILYLGVSFTDSYVNQLRSEVLELIGYERGHDEIGYAVLPRLKPAQASYLLDHEGIRALEYDAEGDDHSGFDDWLGAIHDETSAPRQLASTISGKRIVWSDPNDYGNAYGMMVLRRAQELVGAREDPVEYLTEDEETVRSLERAADLLITNWGHSTDRAVRLLDRIRAQEIAVPWIVFAAPGEKAAANKRVAMKMGAAAYCTTWESLFSEIERVLGPAT